MHAGGLIGGSEAPLAAWLSLAALAAVHVLTPSLRFLRGTPRSIWLSLFGGVSVSYVFVHLLPELAAGQTHVSRALRDSAAGVAFAERHVYIVALAGLAVFYGLERMAKVDRSQREGEQVSSGRTRDSATATSTGAAVFWIHMASFGIYNALIGYLLVHRPVTTTRSLIFFAIAMALHFVVTDYGLDEDHQARFRHIGRWVLVAAVVIGFAAGIAVEIPEVALAVLVAFLAGGVILNVLKEEVPSERQSRFWSFAVGLAAYAALLLAV
ncbi:MAG: hypothetical protein ABI637_00965 [Gemmatimonadota bacterium]